MHIDKKLCLTYTIKHKLRIVLSYINQILDILPQEARKKVRFAQNKTETRHLFYCTPTGHGKDMS